MLALVYHHMKLPRQPSTIGYAYHELTNKNGQYLVDFCEEQNLISCFHRQPHKRNHMWTWEHPNMRNKAQIDHILVRKKWANSVRKCRAYSSVEIDSDHRMVTANIKISLRTPKKHPTSPTPDFSALQNSAELQQLYSVEISNRFAALADNTDIMNTQQKYDQIVEILEKANRTILPKRKKQRDKWVSKDSDDLMQEQQRARTNFRNHRNDQNYLSWRQAAIAVEESLANDKTSYLQQKCSEAEEASRQNQ